MLHSTLTYTSLKTADVPPPSQPTEADGLSRVPMGCCESSYTDDVTERRKSDAAAAAAAAAAADQQPFAQSAGAKSFIYNAQIQEKQLKKRNTIGPECSTPTDTDPSKRLRQGSLFGSIRPRQDMLDADPTLEELNLMLGKSGTSTGVSLVPDNGEVGVHRGTSAVSLLSQARMIRARTSSRVSRKSEGDDHHHRTRATRVSELHRPDDKSRDVDTVSSGGSGELATQLSLNTPRVMATLFGKRLSLTSEASAASETVSLKSPVSRGRGGAWTTAKERRPRDVRQRRESSSTATTLDGSVCIDTPIASSDVVPMRNRRKSSVVIRVSASAHAPKRAEDVVSDTPFDGSMSSSSNSFTNKSCLISMPQRSACKPAGDEGSNDGRPTRRRFSTASLAFEDVEDYDGDCGDSHDAGLVPAPDTARFCADGSGSSFSTDSTQHGSPHSWGAEHSWHSHPPSPSQQEPTLAESQISAPTVPPLINICDYPTPPPFTSSPLNCYLYNYSCPPMPKLQRTSDAGARVKLVHISAAVLTIHGDICAAQACASEGRRESISRARVQFDTTHLIHEGTTEEKFSFSRRRVTPPRKR